MSCYLIEYKNKSKVMVPVTSQEEYIKLRSSKTQHSIVQAVRNGNTKQKTKLLQFNYSCIPEASPPALNRAPVVLSGNCCGSATARTLHYPSTSPCTFTIDTQSIARHDLSKREGSPSGGSDSDINANLPNTPPLRGELEGGSGLLKGCKTPSTSVGMDIDHIAPEDMKALAELIVECKDELGLLMLERSVRGEGYHLVFRRRPEMTQEENLHWASDLIGVPFDPSAKDITRVFFATTSSPEDLIFLSQELFVNEANKNLQNLQNTVQSPDNEEKNNSCNSCSGKRPFGSITVNSCSDKDYNGIDYSLIVGALETLLGGAPAHGSRNNFIFTMEAYLRYVCNDDPDWIAAILPTYGEARDKWRRTIDSACQRSQYKTMPQVVKQAIEIARTKALPLGGDGGGLSVPPPMPSKLPKLIAHLVKNVPEVCRPAVANAVFPSLAAHLKGVKFWLIDGTEKEATFMCVTMAKQSSGKSAVNKPIEYIVADIVERDEINRQREQDWKDASANKGANKEKPKRPDDLCVQVLVSDMTNAAFVQRMKDANGKYLYTNLEELDLLKQLQTNGTKDVGKIICLCFDNGKYGQERVGTQSVTARVDLRWNWNASSTIQKGIKFFRGHLVDGTLSRINFCTIIQDHTKKFCYGRYDDEYAATLKPYINNLNMVQGSVECPEALAMANGMLSRLMDEAALTGDEMLEDMAFRAVTIAYLKAMVLFIAHDMTWSDEIAQFAEWSLDYDLWCKGHFFGQLIAEAKSHEEVKTSGGRCNLLDLLPERFSIQQLQDVRRMVGMHGDAHGMIRQWVFRGYVVREEAGQWFVKTSDYKYKQWKRQ